MVRAAIAFVVTVSLVGAVLLRLTPRPSSPGSATTLLRARGRAGLAIASFGLVFMGGRDVFEAAFGGIGDTVPAVAIGLGVALLRFRWRTTSPCT